jgi:hypothetical protein
MIIRLERHRLVVAIFSARSAFGVAFHFFVGMEADVYILKE